MHEATAGDFSEDGSDFYTDLDTEEVTIEAVESSEATTDQVFCRKLPKHVKQIFFDDDLGPDTQYAVARVEVADGQCKRLKGKVDSGSQVCILNFATFKKLFGAEAEKKLHHSDVKLTGYGGRRFLNHGKLRVDKVHHNQMTGRRVEFFVSDFGSNIFSLKFCKALKILKILCDQPGSCRDCHGEYDVGEVKGNQKSKDETTLKKGRPYSLKVKNPIQVNSTQQVINVVSEIRCFPAYLSAFV